jgi:hypothetical protein
VSRPVEPFGGVIPVGPWVLGADVVPSVDGDAGSGRLKVPVRTEITEIAEDTEALASRRAVPFPGPMFLDHKVGVLVTGRDGWHAQPPSDEATLMNRDTKRLWSPRGPAGMSKDAITVASPNLFATTDSRVNARVRRLNHPARREASASVSSAISVTSVRSQAQPPHGPTSSGTFQAPATGTKTNARVGRLNHPARRAASASVSSAISVTSVRNRAVPPHEPSSCGTFQAPATGTKTNAHTGRLNHPARREASASVSSAISVTSVRNQAQRPHERCPRARCRDDHTIGVASSDSPIRPAAPSSFTTGTPPPLLPEKIHHGATDSRSDAPPINATLLRGSVAPWFRLPSINSPHPGLAGHKPSLMRVATINPSRLCIEGRKPSLVPPRDNQPTTPRARGAQTHTGSPRDHHAATSLDQLPPPLRNLP